jgi:2-polyprenyl-6-hydroxyphenyl methylase/3-demethylubiquinone-9 3-methyltransferase
VQFDFGANWKEFSEKALSPEKIQQARDDFRTLMDGIGIQGVTFLDIGFGQGLTLFIASETGAKVAGCEINPICNEVLEYNRGKFPHLKDRSIPVVTGSILDANVVRKLKEIPFLNGGLYGIVHSWGVLHHTGNMYEAIKAACGLVEPGGHLVISIYTRHWTSKIWLLIKWMYNKSPTMIQKLFVYCLFPVIYLAKFLVTGRNPLRSKRGMDFFYDVIDWVGGYPYEYATKEEVIKYVENLGFKCLRFIPAPVPTGCNEFIFQKGSEE